MASTKPSATPIARRKFSKGMIITLKLSPKALQAFAPTSSSSSPVKEEPLSKESAPAIPPQTATSSNGDNPSESNPNTPAPVGTPGPSSMPPPLDILKKKKRGQAALDPNAPPKVRGKPGPKKKARLEDGSIDHSSTAPRAANGTTAHKLGPKANQGAINAGLRALDRSGKPCRKWQKGGFKLKSFTGVVWEIPRWKAPPKIAVEGKPEEQSASGDSSKENKENSQMESIKSEKSNSGVDVEMGSTGSQNVSSPAPSIPSIPAQAAAPAVTAAA